MPSPAETATEQLVAARTAHAVAIANHQEAIARAGRAAELHRTAAGQRQAMLDRAAGGEFVAVEDLKRADMATADARDTVDLRRAVVGGAAACVHVAQIAELQAIAGEIHAREHAERCAAIEAAQSVDTCLDHAREALAHFQAVLGRLRGIAAEAVVHNTSTVPMATAANPAMERLHPSELPKCNPIPGARADLHVALLRSEGGFGGGTRQAIASLAAVVADLAPVPVAARPASKAA